MKRNIALTLAVLFSVSVAFSQTTKRVQGPNAKNAKVWVNKGETTKVYTYDSEKVTGGNAKNQQVWAKNTEKSTPVQVTANNTNLALKGATAKNSKHKTVAPINAQQAPATNLADIEEVK